MTQEEIIEGNRIIAEFMGAKKSGVHTKYGQLYSFEDKMGVYWGAKLLYNSSWDWLMPVVEKIESLVYKVAIEEKSCTIYKKYGSPICVTANWETKIYAVYQAVIGFINWYKDNK